MLPDGREQGVLRGWIRSLACHYGSRALPLANPICYRLIGQITYYYRRFISHISSRLRPLVTSPLITGRVSLPRVLNRVLRRSCALYCRKNMYIYRECLKKFLVLLNFFSLFIYFSRIIIIVTIDTRSIRNVRFISVVCYERYVCLIIFRGNGKLAFFFVPEEEAGDDCFHKIKYL